ncbi:phage tail protein [Clostridium beijerinckii]|uniref:Phage-related tail fiber protein n=1 Tax=Clostridium beijerinckii TaxID=1520 RepID=A0AAX0B6H3_CLOBE|nr:phage tail protein [Clostridium beijerinckii]NRT90084.1 phage-related tail fiber protein [Clostridium beijerinckii]NYC69614.1 phage-related tail fiber protein [Clostridium beijerinckii]
MAESYYSILTNVGKAQIANAIGLGNKIDFVKMKVGDGNGSYYNPTESQTDLVHTVWEGAIGHVAVDENNSNWINIEVLIPPDVGGFFIREYGIFDANNNMLAVAKCAETYKPLPADGSTKEINMKMIIAVSNTSSITLKIDPTILFAKKKDVDEVSTRVDQLSVSINNINTQLSDMVYQIAGGSATAITLAIKGTLVNGYPITFIASANNGGAATTINGKKLYKPGTTTSPNLISGKAYTVWYNSIGDCFFIKASAEGDADVSHVLATKKFSNDNDTGLTGTMPNNGAVSFTLTNNNQEYIIPAGFHNGLGKIKAIITNLAASVIKAGTTVGGILGTFTSDATAVAADIINGKTAYVNGNKITGNATIESLGGRQYTSGVVNHTANTTDTITLPFIPSVIIIGFSAGAQKAAYWISNSNQTSSTTFYYLSDRSAVSGYSHTENTNTIIVTSAYSGPTYYFAWA